MKILAALTLILYGANAFPKQLSDLGTLASVYNDLTKVYSHYIQRPGVPSSGKFSMNWDDWLRPKRDYIRKRRVAHNQYDFIIVGSGSAGSVLANRLTEVPHWNVLLLEAGKGENTVAQVPLVAPALQFTDYNWNYFMEYQPDMCTGLERHRMHWPRGRALGGTTVINYMIYTRGNRRDYDRWAASGNPGWSFQDVLPYFLKSERGNNRLVDLAIDPEDHGFGGYQSVENIYKSRQVDLFIEAGQELGYPHIDYNANKYSQGFSPIQATVLNGRRDSAAKAFLRSVKGRDNLHILTSAYVTKIIIDPHTKRATGVEFERKGKTYRIDATREVILSAGAFNSPQLLMLAGIGPKEHLAELGIECLQDLPVGKNLQDHISFVGMAYIINQTLSLSAENLLTVKSISGFLERGVGPYTSLGGVEAIAYIKTEISDDPEDVPDIELIFIDGSLSTDYGIVNRRGMNIRDDIYDGLFRPLHNLPTWTVLPMLLHPKSTGFMKLISKNPYDFPVFYGNYYTDPEQKDIRTMLAAIRFTQKISNSRSYQRVRSTLNPSPHPGCEHLQFDSDEYWFCALRSVSVTLHHQVGTAKMGAKGDPTAVVDNELRVHGIEGLRVADCSVIPFALGAHTNAPSMMIGEKAADMIKAAWGELPLGPHQQLDDGTK